MGNCFGTPDAVAAQAAKPPSPAKGPPPARPKPSDGGLGAGRVLEAPRLREFTLAELRAATRGFKPEMVLGEGGFGRVYKGWVDERTLNPAKGSAGVIVAVAAPHGIIHGLRSVPLLLQRRPRGPDPRGRAAGRVG